MAQKPYQEVREYPLSANEMFECCAVALSRMMARIERKDTDSGLIQASKREDDINHNWRITITIASRDESRAVVTVSVLALSPVGVVALFGYSDKNRKPATAQFFSALEQVIGSAEAGKAGEDLAQAPTKAALPPEVKPAQAGTGFDTLAIVVGSLVSIGIRVLVVVVWVGMSLYQQFHMNPEGENLVMTILGGAAAFVGAAVAAAAKRRFPTLSNAALEGAVVGIVGALFTNLCGSIGPVYRYSLTFEGWVAYIVLGLLGGWLASLRRSGAH